MFLVLELVPTGTGVTDVAGVLSFYFCQPGVYIPAEVCVIAWYPSFLWVPAVAGVPAVASNPTG
jgi:hypothetical protein